MPCRWLIVFSKPYPKRSIAILIHRQLGLIDTFGDFSKGSESRSSKNDIRRSATAQGTVLQLHSRMKYNHLKVVVKGR